MTLYREPKPFFEQDIKYFAEALATEHSFGHKMITTRNHRDRGQDGSGSRLIWRETDDRDFRRMQVR